ncbi:LLM class flavin-dependent oxidoreductase [Streptomyces sp. NPDC048231]|uniref:LLM class flavin-dependent oxidoreductase n=1 Tax=Streptomyces sp. NPDC048231 TaxID=3365519 RepID=UPI0037226197
MRGKLEPLRKKLTRRPSVAGCANSQTAGTPCAFDNPLPAQVATAHDARMRFSINIPNFGDFADPRNVATAAAAAEESGWDRLFVWDHVHYRAYSGRPFGDAWMLPTAATLATSRIRVGTLLTPVARYRPQQLARQVATLDNLSKGRVVFAAGLGGPVEDEYGSFGDSTDRRVLATAGRRAGVAGTVLDGQGRRPSRSAPRSCPIRSRLVRT